MANVKISELPASTTPLTGGELIPIVQSGITKNVSVDNLTAGKSISVSGITTSGTALTMTGSTASGSGLVLAPTIVRLNADRLKPTNDTNPEAVFDSGNDTLALSNNTLYYFKGIYIFTIAATTSNAAIRTGFIFSNTQQSISYRTRAFYTTNTGSSVNVLLSSPDATTSVTTASTSAFTHCIDIEGWFKSNATTGGTVIPAFCQSNIAGATTTASALANSWLMIQPMSSDVNATLIAGNWS